MGEDHARFMSKSSDLQDRLEQKWVSEANKLGYIIASDLESQIMSGKSPRVPGKRIFREFVFRHYMEVVELANDTAIAETQVIDHEKRLAKSPRIPRKLAEVRKAYDIWKRTGRMPKGLADQAAKIQDLYLKSVHKVWKRYSEDFRAGDEVGRFDIVKKVKKAADVANSRAKNIVRTETTNHYNEVRAEIYDQNEGIWGYLFLAIRDHATTKWCTDKTKGGKRGRHGLVYKKGDPLTTKERPSCHWNCRSEMTPLTPYNPRHKRLIENDFMQRRNHTCHPLPEGWR